MSEDKIWSAGDVVKQLSTNKIMSAICLDKEFKYENVSVDMQELVPYKKYKLVVTNQLGKLEEHEIEASDDEDGRNLRDMKKHPQNMYPILVSYIENDLPKSKIILEHHKGNVTEGVLKALTEVIQLYMDIHNITTLNEMKKVVEDYEKENMRKSSLKNYFVNKPY